MYGTTTQHNGMAAVAAARPLRGWRRERPHGRRHRQWLVVDSVHQAGHVPQAPAPSVPGDLLVTHERNHSPGRRGTPGGLFRVPDQFAAPADPPTRDRTTPQNRERERRGTAMFALEPTAVIEDEPWRIDARCADGTSALVDLFFSEQLDDILRAKAFCVECPVKDECLAAAVERREPGASGAASSSPTARCSPTSGAGVVHRRCVRPSRCSRSSSPGTTRRTRSPRAPDRSPHRRAGVTRPGNHSPRDPDEPRSARGQSQQ